MKLFAKIIKRLKTVQSSTFSSLFIRLSLLTVGWRESLESVLQSGLDIPKVRVSDIRRPLVSAFASRKPPDGSPSNRPEALKVGLEHAGGITYPIWPWKFSGPAGEHVWLVSFSRLG